MTGRRLRRRRSPDEGLLDDGAIEDEAGHWPSQEDVDEALLQLEHTEVTPVRKEEKRGFFASLRRLVLGDKTADRERGAPPPSEDPVRAILAVPQGPARLDAFAETVKTLSPGTPGHRSVALGFYRELSIMAARAGVDLKLLKHRVEACADALVDAGEHERAGELLSRVGKQNRAAELFASAGAIEKLEAAHFDLEHAEGGGRHHEARLAYERFEALFAVGQRQEAFDELARARTLWPQNPVYVEIEAGIDKRRLEPGRLLLETPEGRIRVAQRWPVLIGRGDDVALRLKSPLVSREHAALDLVEGRVIVSARQSRHPLVKDGEPLGGPTPLDGEGRIDLGGVELDYRVSDDVVQLACVQQPEEATLAVRGRSAAVPLGGGGFTLAFDDAGRACLEPGPGLTLNRDPVRQRILLLEHDVIERGGARAAVRR